MSKNVNQTPNGYAFDDRNIRWFKLGEFEHFVFTMLDVDAERGLVDAMLKYTPDQQIFLHRHLFQTNTLVVQGEHRFYEADGTLRETRPTGTYTVTPADAKPHREGGGPEGAVVLYSLRADREDLFEILDDELRVVGTLGMQDFITAHNEQRNAA